MAGAKEIPLHELSIQQLNQLSQQLEQELEVFQSSLSSLKVAQTKFVECKESLNRIGSSPDNKDILVPLTSSMYVTGQLTETETALVDIGTGYYVEMTLERGKEYYQRKVDYLTREMEKLQSVLQEKFQLKEVIVEMLQAKVHAQISAQQQLSSTVATKS